jgi:signal transduction histidine kinase/DNA-binding response OmpR family regulator
MTRKLSETNSRLTDIVTLSAKKITLSQDILIHVLIIARHEKNMILENNPSQMKRYEDEIKYSLAIIDTEADELLEITDENGKKILKKFISSWEVYKVSLDRIIILSLKNEDEKAFNISINTGYTVREEAMAALNMLVQKNSASMASDKSKSDEGYKSAITLIIGLISLSLALALVLAYWIISGIGKRISFISREAEKIASREFIEAEMKDTGKDELSSIFNSLVAVNNSFNEITESAYIVASGNYLNDFSPRSERDKLGNALKKMTVSLRNTTADNIKHTWLTTGQNLFNEKLRGDQEIYQLSNNIISFLCRYVDASIGAVYMLKEDNTLILSGSYAFTSQQVQQRYFLGEGLIGQVAREMKPLMLTAIDDEHFRVNSTVLAAKPKSVYVLPFIFDGGVLGVIEIGHLNKFSETSVEFINSSMENIGISVHSAISRDRIKQLLEETQAQSEELQSQQEELRQVNEELEEQTHSLKQQQEELQMTNEELEEQTQSLELKNREVEKAHADIEEKTKQLEISSKYKSEFLANMSHELRTPLNSLLILSKDLADNKSNNLTPDQIESAEIVNKSGHDLLALINEVLDLSKIEAGKMTLNLEQVSLKNMANSLYRDFKHHAESKGLKLTVDLSNDLPEHIVSDAQRLNQILKNLLSNAIKFTAKGEVNLKIHRPDNETIAISVHDTGIGIPEDKQMTVFEAFQQAEGGTSRKYGGTGLGLSISRELAKLLHGEISLTSVVNKGSVFTLTIPIQMVAEKRVHKPARVAHISTGKTFKESDANINYPTIEDDRKAIESGDKIVLIVEDDINFATILRNQAKSKGFKCLAASTGEDGLLLAGKYKPHAIILDIDLPGIDGHQVLAELKANISLRHIPVHIISVNERTIEPIKEGAVEYLTKPVNKKQMEEAFSRIENFIARKMRNLLIVEDDANSRKAIRKLIGNGDVHSFEASTGEEAINLYKDNHIDCIVLDIGLPDITGFSLIHKLNEIKTLPPVIVYTGKDLTKEENEELEKYAESIIIKGAKSEERLLDETALFLHRTIDNLPESKQRIISNLYNKEYVFTGKKILVVDDDMRNVFAISKILKEKGMEIIKAENGSIALEQLKKDSNISLVLMDIMMPEMDGYEAMQQIRAQVQFKHLPIIALTAKAMKEDKQKCINAGANDYITKPIDVERLLSLMRVWLSKMQ